jgi:hypothetical protein
MCRGKPFPESDSLFGVTTMMRLEPRQNKSIAAKHRACTSRQPSFKYCLTGAFSRPSSYSCVRVLLDTLRVLKIYSPTHSSVLCHLHYFTNLSLTFSLVPLNMLIHIHTHLVCFVCAISICPAARTFDIFKQCLIL